VLENSLSQSQSGIIRLRQSATHVETLLFSSLLHVCDYAYTVVGLEPRDYVVYGELEKSTKITSLSNG